MPTAAKFVAALALAVVMFVATVNYIPGLPEGTQVHNIREIAAAIGFICGWFVVGPQPGNTFAESLSNGVKGALVAAFFILILVSAYTMIKRAMRMMYDGVMDAVLGVFQQFVEFAALLFAPGVIGVLLVGGVVVGLLTKWASRRWS